MRTTFAAAAVAAVVLITAAACGESRAQLGGSASVLPVDTQVYVALDTKLSPGERAAADELLGRFPAQSPMLARVRAHLEDLEPLLGRELDLVLTRAGGTVALAQPKDPDRARQLLGAGVTAKKLGAWTAFGESSALGALSSAPAAAPLAKAPAYLAAMTSVPDGAIVRAYASPTQAEALLGEMPGQSLLVTGVPGRRARPPAANQNRAVIAAQTPAWAAASVVDAGHAELVEARAQLDPPPESVLQRASLSRIATVAYEPRLLDEIPADAVFVADIPVSQSEFEVETEKLPAPLAALLGRYPSLGGRLDAALAGETAIYVRPGLPDPEVTIVSQPLDTVAARQNVADGMTDLRATGGIFAGLRLHVAVLGGQLVISTSQHGLDVFRGPGPKLSADPAFAAARKASGMPAAMTGFVYADLRRPQPLAGSLAGLLGVALPRGGGPVRSLLAYASRRTAQSNWTVSLQLR